MNSKWLEHGDQAADWIEPVGMVQRSGVHSLVCQTRNTQPAVDVNKRWLFGDHFTRAHGIPIRFNGIFRFVSISHTIAFGSLKLTDTNNDPLRFHSNELIGWWFVLEKRRNKTIGVWISHNIDFYRNSYYCLKNTQKKNEKPCQMQ